MDLIKCSLHSFIKCELSFIPFLLIHEITIDIYYIVQIKAVLEDKEKM